MTPEQDQQISALFHAARALTSEQRAAFLAEACAGDKALRREVEELLAVEEQAGNFLQQPVHAVAANLFHTSSGSISAGHQLGRYRILSHLGAGGMGEVYLAEDTQLDRRVAIKVLPAEFTSDADRVRRFVREAKAASALNHPNILTIYEIGQSETLHYIVTEYVDGQTLRECIAAGPMPIEAALDVAIQVAGALSTAHEAGIMHRDIKPENLMLRRDGYAKLLDFGLAKLVGLRIADRGLQIEENETMTLAPTNSPQSALRNPQSTAPGMVMGTANYMSPEQARGLAVDARTDIFSLGVVLYEMIAGRAPFGGVNAIEVMGAILNQEPAPLPSHVTAQLVEAGAAGEMERITGKALEKDREQRYQTSNDLLLDLRKLKGESGARSTVSDASAEFGSSDPSSAAAHNKRRNLLQLAAIVLAGAAVIGAVAYFTLDRGPARSAGPLSVVPFSSLPGTETEPAFSPDGNQLAFVWDGGRGGQTDIYIKLIGTGGPLRLTNNPAYEIAPSWSPDGRHIAFVRQEGAQNAVLIVPALGGPERKLCTGSQNMYRLSWSPDGQWLATAAERPDNRNISQIVLVSLATGEKRPVTNPPPGDGEYLAAFSPDGRQLAFVRDSAQTGSDLYLTTILAGQAQGERRLTTGSRTINGLAWTANGRELIYDSNRLGNRTLWRVPSAGGEPHMLFSGGASYRLPAVARQGGRLAFTESKTDTNTRRIELPDAAWTGQAGRVEIRWEAVTKLISSAREDGSPQYSPDGKKIAFTSNRSGSMEIWVCDSDGSNPLQLTNLPGAYTGSPHWSPDGRYLVFDARPDMRSDLFVISAEGGTPRRLTNDSSYNVIPSWSRDGAWIYFCSRRSGENQIWKMPAAGGPAVQVTTKGGFEALEAPDGITIYYSKERGGDGLWTVPSAGGEEERVPELTEAGYWRSWTMTNDGIYFVAKVGSGPPRPLKFFHFATRRITQFGTVDRDPLWWESSLSVSADNRWLLYAHSEQNTSNIMLVENFR